MAEKSSVIGTLKRSHIATKSRRVTVKDFLKSLDYSFPERRKKQTKNPKLDEFVVVESKKDRSKREQNMHIKYAIDWANPGVRGNLFIRFAYLNSKDAPKYVVEQKHEVVKMVNQLLRTVGINLGKKVANEYYLGVFSKIFDAYIEILEDCTIDILKEKIEEIVSADFDEINLGEEEYVHFLKIFGIVIENIEHIYSSPVDFDGSGKFSEVNLDIKLTYDDIVKQPEEETTATFDDLNFDIFDMANEYISFEDIDGGVIVRKGLRDKKGGYSNPTVEAPKKVSTYVSTLASKEDAQKLANLDIENLVEQEGKNFKGDFEAA